MEKQFRIILSGMPMDGFEQDLVRASLALLFQISDEKAGRILSGKRIALKKSYSQKNAKALRDKLLGIGAECTLRIVQEDGKQNAGETPVKHGIDSQANNDRSRKIVDQKDSRQESPKIQTLSNEADESVIQKNGEELSAFPLPVKIAIAGFVLMA